jgi:hypothetical protein
LFDVCLLFVCCLFAIERGAQGVGGAISEDELDLKNIGHKILLDLEYKLVYTNVS